MAQPVEEKLPTQQGEGGDSLTTISLSKLVKDDHQTRSDLFTACKELGFFYLDCRDDPSGQTLPQVADVATASLNFYDLPESSKDQWKVQTKTVEGEEFKFGYKKSGIWSGCIEGKKDGWEGIQFHEHPLKVFPRDKPLPVPEVLQNSRNLVEATQANLGKISRIILSSLSRSMGMDGSKNLVEYHQSDLISGTTLEVLKYLPYSAESEKVGHLPHTDIGSLSTVFADVGGLQVFHPIKKTWIFIEPKPGHAVCNIGDSTQFLSHNVLKSSLHRVVPHPLHKDKIKVSVIYFLRPNLDAVFVGRDGKKWKSADWQEMKVNFLTEGLKAKGNRATLTGREGHDEFWDNKQVNQAPPMPVA